MKELHNVTDLLSYWAFSDIFEEVGLPQTEFSGMYGVETFHGVAKPVKRAFELLHRHAGDKLLDTTITTQNDDVSTKQTTQGGCNVTEDLEDLGCFDQKEQRDTGCFNKTDMTGLGLHGLSKEACLDYCWRWGSASGSNGQGRLCRRESASRYKVEPLPLPLFGGSIQAMLPRLT